MLTQTTQHALTCMEIWGGNRRVQRTIEMPDVHAWVYSNPIGMKSGGDVHYFSVCGQEVLSRVALADVSGHGEEVSGPAETLHALMREHINTWDQTEFVKGLNRSFRGCASNGKYATAIVLGFVRESREVVFTNAGHLPPLMYRAEQDAWSWLDERACETNCSLDGLPVGLIRGTNYRQTVIEMAPADILILYTDGITEATNNAGEMVESGGLLHWASQAPTQSAAAAGEFLLQRLNEFRSPKDSVDDETIVAIQKGIPS